jgi:hypothetical protein
VTLEDRIYQRAGAAKLQRLFDEGMTPERLGGILALYVQAVARFQAQVAAAWQPIIQQVKEHPELLDQWRQERAAEEQPGSCHCLCCAVHPGSEGVCDSYAEPGLTVTFHSPTVGTQHVKFCRNCYDARQAEQKVGAEA